jgi:hypothetical protein
MQKRMFSPKENPFYWSPEDHTLLTQNFSRKELHHLFHNFRNIDYFNMLLGYAGEITETTDLFEFLDSKDLDQLRFKKTFLIFDATFEGYSQLHKPLISALTYSAKKYNIDPKKIFLFTGNFKDNSNDINVVPIFLLDGDWSWGGHRLDIDQSKKDCFNNYKKIILSLSRRNRYLRVVGHFALYHSSIANQCMISQDRLDNNIVISKDALQKLSLNEIDWNIFKNNLPLLVDGDNFHINSPFDPLPLLHSKTLFSIVNETLISNYNDTSLFFSEKLLKPIMNFQPLIIYGQPGINKKINMLGFKTYENYFDLSFDDEPDDIIRYKKLLSSIEETVRYLKSLNKEQQVNWRYKEKELLNYNYQVFIRKENTKKQLELFSEKLTSVFLTKS